MPLDRKTVDSIAGRQIHDLMQTRHVSAEEKRMIRQRHEQAARRAEQKHAKR
jgi:hypothetical protein